MFPNQTAARSGIALALEWALKDLRHSCFSVGSSGHQMTGLGLLILCPRYCTGKSQLLQQLRAFRKRAVPPQQSASDSHGGQKAQASEDTAGLQTQRKKQIKLWAEKQNALDLGDALGTQLLPDMGQL